MAGNPVLVAGSDGTNAESILVDSTGAQVVVGAAADTATAVGNPVLIAGVQTSGAVAQLALSAAGHLTFARQAGADGQADIFMLLEDAGSNSDLLAAVTLRFNGLTWDRDFACTSSAVVTVAAGSTTEIVALVSNDIIRVCGFVLSMATTGTFQWVEGTGSDCATGASDLTSDIDLVAGNAFSAYGNPEIFRNTVSEALCLTAVTGAVDGVVTFAQY